MKSCKAYIQLDTWAGEKAPYHIMIHDQGDIYKFYSHTNRLFCGADQTHKSSGLPSHISCSYKRPSTEKLCKRCLKIEAMKGEK